MTEQNLNQNISSDSMSGMANNASSASAASSQDEMIPKSYATKLVHERYNHGYEKGKQDALAELQRQSSPAQSANDPILHELRNEVKSLKSQMQQKEDERIDREKKAAEDAKNAEIKAQVQQVSNQLTPKIEEARKKYSDFDAVVNVESLKDIPEFIGLANTADNAGEILYELLKNPERLGQIRGLPPSLAVRAISNLSHTLKTNQASANLKVPRSPISQPQASYVKNVDKKADATQWAKNHRW